MDREFERQAGHVLAKNAREKVTVTFIDQEYCFNAGEWTFPDYPLQGEYAQNEVYSSVRGWKSFQPWLSTIGGHERKLHLERCRWNSAGMVCQ